ncbi:MAG: hypothetical protein JWO89_3038 [Verrucomicrobiaceae bacterium]|nr:hypothetical protein [Verrucomicrobiaceae bacterium]
MSEFVLNFLRLHVHNATLPVHVALGGIWLMLLAAGLWSVQSQARGFLWKFLWSTALIVLPWLGMLLYALRCVLVSDFAFLKPLGLGAKKTNRLAPAPGSK